MKIGTSITLPTSYTAKDGNEYELKVTAIMNGIEDYPQIVDFEFEYFDGVDKIIRELDALTEDQLDKLFGDLDWSQAYGEYQSDAQDFYNDEAHEESKY
jgi:hypothetical protein